MSVENKEDKQAIMRDAIKAQRSMNFDMLPDSLLASWQISRGEAAELFRIRN